MGGMTLKRISYFCSVLWLTFACAGHLGCVKRIPFERPPDLDEAGVRRRLEGQCAARKQVVVKLKANSYGIKRLIGSVELQLIAQSPDQLFLEARSFFDQPMLVLTSNGKEVNWLDLRDPSGPRFGTETANSTRVVDIFGVELTPLEVISLALGTPPIYDAQVEDIQFDADKNIYSASFMQKNGRKIRCAFRTVDDTISSCAVYKTNGELVYDLLYEDFRRVGLLQVAHRWILKVRQNNEENRLKLVALDLQFNSDMFPESTFHLEAP